jgi:Transposase family tnp2
MNAREHTMTDSSQSQAFSAESPTACFAHGATHHVSQVASDRISEQASSPATENDSVAVDTDQLRVQNTYHALVTMDSTLTEHLATVSDMSPENPLMTIEETWFQSTLRDLHSIDTCGDEATILLKEAIHRQINGAIQTIEARTARANSANPAPEGESNAFDTGEFCQYFGYLLLISNLFMIDVYFHNDLDGNPFIIVPMFLVLALNLFGHLARPSCNFALRIMKLLIQWFLQWDGPLDKRKQKMLDAFPTDVRQVQTKFRLNPKLTTFATCPKCCYTHAPQPTQHPHVLSWPTRCQYPGRYEHSRPCNEELTTHGVQDGKSVRVPIRPFAYQPLPAFVAGLLSRPGMEDVIDRAWGRVGRRTGDEEMLDIWDGSGVPELQGADGKPFSDGPADEARLVWSLSVDWFNPYQNKQSGKKASTGSMVMACLNLPPSLRYKPENLYMVGIIPGPKEPQTDEVNNFLRPLVDDLLPSWKEGIWYTKTYRYPLGRRARSALFPLVCDMLGARKVAGGVAPRATQLDPFYSHQKLSDINNIQDWVGC